MLKSWEEWISRPRQPDRMRARAPDAPRHSSVGVSMEIFRELFIDAEPEPMDELVSRLERTLPSGWTRDAETERKLQDSAPTDSGTFCFVRGPNGSPMSALLFIARHPSGRFYVSNIVPSKSGNSLSRHDYNSILEEFHDKALKPAADSLPVRTELTADAGDLEDWMSAETARKLRAFSRQANRSTGARTPWTVQGGTILSWRPISRAARWTRTC